MLIFMMKVPLTGKIDHGINTYQSIHNINTYQLVKFRLIDLANVYD